MQFDSKKVGDVDIANGALDKLEQGLAIFRSTITQKMVPPKKYGYLTITIKSAIASTHAQGVKCDAFSGCDPYVKIVVSDSNQVFATRTLWDQYYPDFDETFTTKKIDKDSMILIQLWDFDGWSSNDLMLSWDVSVKKLLKTSSYKYGNNKVFVSSSWQNA